jgi:AraC-like DNA-binding protein
MARGRPKNKIDPDQVFELAKLNCSLKEIASVLKCCVSTLERHFAEVIHSGRMARNESLKRRQYDLAMAGNVKMLIRLGECELGQAARMQLDVNSLSDEELAAIIEERMKAREGNAE